MKKFVFIFISCILIYILYIYLYSNNFTMKINQIDTDNIEEKLEDSIYIDKELTQSFIDDIQFEDYENYQKIKDILKDKKGLIIVTKNLDFIYDDINNINFVFISLENNILELTNINNENYFLRVRSSKKINPIVSGDKEYFIFVKDWGSMLTEDEYNRKYFYFPLYTISKETLLVDSKYSYITYNMKLEDIKFINIK